MLLLQRRHGMMLCCGGGSSAVATTDHHQNHQSNSRNKQHKEDNKEKARQLSWSQVEAMTCGFTSSIVGEGGFSTVYLARLAGGSLAAVKVHRGSERLQRAFRRELEALLRVRGHPHIVRLLGFCCCESDCDQQEQQGQGGGVLVLEFAPNGNLHDRIHGGNKGVIMPWARRITVALQVARALEYLHDDERCLVHGDVKASNVLLDAAMAARLCDFGSSASSSKAKAHGGPGPTRARPTALLLGSPGYVDPYYLRSGLLTTKSDVYSFGVLLLELVSGRQPSFFCSGRAPIVSDDEEVVDRRLGCRYDPDEAAAVLALAAACVADNPSLRPSMAHIVRTLERTVGTRSSSSSSSSSDA